MVTTKNTSQGQSPKISLLYVVARLEGLRLFNVGRQPDHITIQTVIAMTQDNIPFQVIDWTEIERTEHPGQTGSAFWQTLQLPGLRIRIVRYSAGYLADHWCQMGHIVHCLEGELITEHEDGNTYKMNQGMTYVVSDNLSSHRSVAENEVKLLIIDGDFLMRK